jgi:predicted O-linked N-acetylglucosamine transferase (SPINDLY family)
MDDKTTSNMVAELERALILHQSGQLQEAGGIYHKLQPVMGDDPRLLTPMGILRYQLGDAQGAEDILRFSLEKSPQQTNALLNLGNALQDLNRVEEAITCFDQVLALDPEDTGAHYNRGNAYSVIGKNEEALQDYIQTFRLDPGFDYLPGKIIHAKMQLCDWDNLDILASNLRQAIEQNKKCTVPFPLQCLFDSLGLQQLCTAVFSGDKFHKQSLPPIGPRTYNSKIRIAYFSSDFRDHPLSHLLVRTLENHDKDRFEVYAFSLGPKVDDAWRKRVIEASDRFIDARELSDRDVAELGRSLGIDIAVDLNGYTKHSRTQIFVERVAPVQISYIGYLGTMGLSCIDYIVADEVIIPEASQKYYSEKVVYLPWFQSNADRTEISEKRYSREDMGLPDGKFVYCSFNTNYKITPDIFGVWMRILKRVPESVLWLYVSTDEAKENLLAEAAMRGIKSDRLIFAEKMPFKEHLARQKVANLFLDTFPYNAGATASNALRVSLPVLTCLGESFAARMGASLLKTLEMDELIASSMDEYESRAVEWGNSPKRFRRVKKKLTRNLSHSQLFDNQAFTRNLERAYTGMHQKYLNGDSPDHIHVKPDTQSDRHNNKLMKTLLHVGCGPNRIDATTRGFSGGGWKELRLDIDQSVTPDIVGTMTDMSGVESGSVDAVFSSHNIEHLYVHEIPEALGEFRRVLAEDGFCVITCPDLQSVCELVAQDKLTDTAYVSPAGPIAPIDILYGHRASMAKGNLFMAHRSGFTETALRATLYANGFQSVATMRRLDSFDLWAIAIKSKQEEKTLMSLARAHFPVGG